jgi:alpha-tubulin suppressor-like RCC1 family protein/chitodextrinase
MGKLRRHVGRAIFITLVAVGLPVGINAPATSAATAGTPWTWGSNGLGQLGDGSTTPRKAGPVPGLTNVVSVSGGRDHVLALTSDGAVYAWGSNDQGEIGDGTTTNRLTPFHVLGLPNIIAVSAGHYHSMALAGDGTIWAWGSNSAGQLGDGTKTIRKSPVKVSGITDAVAIAAGRDMSYAIRANGTAWAWGLNTNGELGDGTTTTRLTPVQVGASTAGFTNVVEIVGGRDHGLARLADGSVWAWGWNLYGQLGDGTTTDRTRPVQITTGVSQIAAGAHHSYALKTNGQVLAWGRNYRAELGDGTKTNRTKPVLVLGVQNAVSIGSGRDHGVAVISDGSVRAWGHDLGGQLGDGGTADHTSAIVVPGVANAVLAGGGGEDYSVVLVGSGSPPPNQPPVAAFSSSCIQLDCSFDGTKSTDSDGLVVSYAWTFGDTGTSTASKPSHSFASAGDQTVTLTVTDDDGDTDQVQATVSVTDDPPPPNNPPVAVIMDSCQALTCSFDGTGSTDSDGLVVSYAWTFDDGGTSAISKPAHTFTTPGDHDVTLTVTDDDGDTDVAMATVSLTSAPPSTVSFRAAGSSDANIAKPNVVVPTGVATGDRLLLFLTTNRAATTTTPTGWTLLSTRSDGTDVRSWVFTRSAVAGMAGSTVQTTLDAVSKSSMTLMAYSGAAAASQVVGANEAASTVNHLAPAAPVSTAGSTVLSYWADKSSTVHTWTLPAAVTSRASTTGSGGGLLTSVTGESAGVAAGTWPGATANAGLASGNAISWTVVLPPS